MRIALAGDSVRLPTSYGGQSLQLGRELIKRGHEVANFALQHAGPPLDVEGIKVHTFTDKQGHALSIGGFRPDVLIHVRDAWTLTEEGADRPYHLRQLTHKFGGKFVSYTPIDHLYYPPFFLEAIDTESDETWVTTDWGMEVMRNAGADMSKLHRFYPGADPVTFHAGPPAPGTRQKFGLPEDVPVFLQVATNWISPRKMQSQLLLAFKSFIDRYDSDAILYLHSPALGWFRLEEIVKDVGLYGKGRVALRNGAGVTSHMVGVDTPLIGDLYRAASALVNLSSHEGFDMPAAEAAACGLPVVATDYPVHREVLGKFSGRNTTFYVPSQRVLPDPVSLTWLASADDAADMMAKALHAPHGSGGVPQDLQWETLAGELEELCRNLME